MEKKPHVHAATIIEWANGARIEYRKPPEGDWITTDHPAFAEDYEYRVKVERRYPDTIMTHRQMYIAFHGVADIDENERFINLINAGLRHAIDNGQVVTREEFKRVSDEANKAARSLRAAGYTDEGGELWKPPLGVMWVNGRNG